MVAEIGYIALLFVVGFSALQIIFSLWGELKHQPQWLVFNPILSAIQSGLALLAFSSLVYGFLVDDFSMTYVAAHSNSALPPFFKFAASWGGHEGSMLFWLMLLTLWSNIFCFFARRIDPLLAHRTLAILGLIIFGFALFIVMMSNPFDHQFPPPPEGRDLNPMLQDIGLIFHPPLLYLGYAGFAVSFAMTVAMLLGGVFDYASAHWIRPWAIASWGFLTAGIVLGAWWAYYELGWGGWWFWDPVENASLMPWLLGIAFIHSLVASQQRGILSYWTILLAIFTFALSLLGTFIVRSGVLTSVHAFAVDADRGIALLLLFFSISVVALALFALRVNLWQGNVHFKWYSKEVALLLLNSFFTLATCVVILGTFYPMVFSAMNWGSISVGAPYFNTVFTPLVIGVMSIMGFATILRWKRSDLRQILQRLLLLPIAIGIALGLSYEVIAKQNAHSLSLLATLFISLAIWIILCHLPYQQKMWQYRPLAMRLAHIGFAICVIGAMMNSYYGEEIGVKLAPNDKATLSTYSFHYVEHRYKIGQNYTAEIAEFHLYNADQQLVGKLFPERRHYDIRTMTMAEVGLAHQGLDDIYIVMGDKFTNKTYAFRLHYKPYVRALWLGGVMMVFATLLALLGHFQRKRAIQ